MQNFCNKKKCLLSAHSALITKNIDINSNYTVAEVNHHVTSSMIVQNGVLISGPIQSRVTMGSFNSNIQNFVGTVAQSQQCNRALEARMPFLFTANEASISRYLDGLLRPAADLFIRGRTLEDLLAFLTTPPPPPTCRH